jgi:Domain of unknown function (DUF3576)
MFVRRPARALVLVGLLAVAACGDDDSKVRPISDNTKVGGEPGLVYGNGKGAGANPAQVGVNAYLWRGALDTLAFMPLASADPFGGVIITDWYQPPSAAGERFKATAYILGRQLRADGVRVSIFRQVSQAGQWVDAPVNPTTTSEIENKVLLRARELRAQTASQ